MKRRIRPHDWSEWRGYTIICARCSVAKTDEADGVSCISDAEAADRAEWRRAAEAAARVMQRGCE